MSLKMEKEMKELLKIILPSVICVFFAVTLQGVPKQTHCPLMVEDEIDEEEFILYKGVKVFMCCGSCREMWAKNPDYFAVVCQEQAPQLKAVASTKIKPMKQKFCPVYTDIRVHPKSLSLKHKDRTIYFSKKRALTRFKANPEKYLKNLE